MPTEPERGTGRSWTFPILVVALAAVLVALVVTLNRDPGPEATGPRTAPAETAPAETGPVEPPGSGGSADPAPTEAPEQGQAQQQVDLSEAERRDEDDLLAAGPVDAPVVLVVFSDYQCPYCAAWSEETLPAMMEHVEAGDLRIEWRDVNVFGPASERAARASYAAALQGEFWEYHDALFADGQNRSERELSEEGLTELAGELGLDTERFAEDLTASGTRQQVEENEELGIGLGAYSTPAFILGGEPLVGAQPTEVFQDAFQQALEQAR